MTGLPKSIIKKYGVTKKAWQIFRGSQSKSRTIRRRDIKQVSQMARRGVYSRARRYVRGRTKGMNWMQLGIMGVGAGFSGVLGGVVQKYATGTSANVAQLLAGAGLTWFGSGMLKTAGKGVLIKAIGDFVEDNVANNLNLGLTNGTSTNSQTNSTGGI